jgi:transposase
MNLILTEPERVTLRELSLNHPHRDIRIKGCGLLMLANGLKPKQIAVEIGCSWRVTYDWFHAWQQSGIAGLLGGHQGGRYLVMTPEMIATAVDVASRELLTLSRIAQRIEEEHGSLPCTLQTLGKTLKRQGFTYKRARYSLKKTQ